MKKKYILLSTVVILLVFIGIKYVIYKPHRTISEEKVFKSFTAENFIEAFEKDTLFLTNYTNQTISIYAKEIELDFENKIGLINNKIATRFEDFETLKNHSLKNVTIKGRLVGYDELLDEFQMDQCIIIENQ